MFVEDQHKRLRGSEEESTTTTKQVGFLPKNMKSKNLAKYCSCYLFNIHTAYAYFGAVY